MDDRTLTELAEELEELLNIPKDSRSNDIVLRINTIEAILQENNFSESTSKVEENGSIQTSGEQRKTEEKNTDTPDEIRDDSGSIKLVDENFSERSSGEMSLDLPIEQLFERPTLSINPTAYDLSTSLSSISSITKSNLTPQTTEKHYIIEETDTPALPDPVTSLYGSSLIDRLTGTSGRDMLYGGTGNDIFHASARNDQYFGGNGSDTLDFSRLVMTSGVTVNLLQSTASSASTGTDRLTSIENITGSTQDDILRGDTNDNTLKGENGDDTLLGLAGNDILFGGLGADTLTGGLGADTFPYEAGDLDGSIDVIVDFNAGDGDAINVSALLTGYDLLKSDENAFIRFVDQGADTVLQINTAGTGLDADYISLATITGGAGLDIDTLVLSGNIITDSTYQQGNILMEGGTWNGFNFFGGAVAISDNYIISGASGYDDTETNEGAVFVYGMDLGTYLIASPDIYQYGSFGASTEINGSYAIITATGADTSGLNNSGAAYLYNLDTGNLLFTLESSNVVENNQFGNDAALSDNYIAIAERYNDTGGSNSGAVHIYNTADGSLARTITNPSANASDYFGNSIALEGNTLVVGAYGDDTGGSSRGAAYVYDVSTGTRLLTLVDPNAADGNSFGVGVAISDQYIAVGATGDDTDGTSSGMVYVYEFGTGNLISTLHNYSPDGNDGMGDVITISNNYVIVGDAYCDYYNTSSGNFHIFNATTGEVVQTIFGREYETRLGASLDATDTILVVGSTGTDMTSVSTAETRVYMADFLNTGVLTGNDTNNSLLGLDGDDTISGGAGDDILYGGTGSDDLYGGTGSDTFAFSLVEVGVGIDTIHDFSLLEMDTIEVMDIEWTENSSATFSDYVRLIDMGDYGVLQINIAGSGLDGDYITLANVYGAQDYSAEQLYNNNQLIINLPDGAEPGVILDTTPVSSSYFGEQTTVNENYVIITSLRDSSIATYQGSADIYDRATGNLLYHLDAPAPTTWDNFGISAAVSGNIAIIGASGNDTSGTNQGAIYFYDLTDGSLIRTISDPANNDHDAFGNTMCAYDDWLIVTAPGDDTGASAAGRAYIYEISTGNLVRIVEHPDPEIGDQFGSSVYMSESYYFVGAAYEDTGGDAAGAGYLFDKTTSNLLNTFYNPDANDDDWFGYSADLTDDYLVIGAYGNEVDGLSRAGNAYVYDTASGALLYTIESNSPGAIDFFATDIKIMDDYVVICEKREDDVGSNTGEVHIYDLDTGSLIQSFYSTSPEEGDEFGTSIQGEGDYLIVGSRYGDDAIENGGGVQEFYIDFNEDGNVSGTTGHDIVMGLDGDDTLFGLDGDDQLYGGTGDDEIHAGTGDDIIYIDDGADVLYGDSGADLFTYLEGANLDGVETIFDFDANEGDVLDISDLLQGYDPLVDALSDFVRVEDQGTDSVVSIDVDGSQNGENFVAAVVLAGGVDQSAEEMFVQGSLDVIQ